MREDSATGRGRAPRRMGPWFAWPGLVMIFALAGLSIVGALPQTNAVSLFNSPPLIVFWCLLLALLLAGPFVFPGLRRPAGLAMHLGPALILIGAMWGSQTAHGLLDRPGPRRGFLTLREGHAGWVLTDENLVPVGELPFAVRLDRFWIEHYGAEDDRWDLAVSLPPGLQHRHTAPVRLAWNVGDSLTIPHTRTGLQVLDYLPRARPVWTEEARPFLEIVTAEGQGVRIPAEAGREVEAGAPPIRFRILRTFANLTVEARGDTNEVIDAPGPSRNPALAVQLEFPDGEREVRYVLPHAHVHAMAWPRMRYVFPAPDRAAKDSDSPLPAMKVLLRPSSGPLETRWLIPPPGSDQAVASFETERGRAFLALVKPPPGPVKDYKSELEIPGSEGGSARKIVEVNDPLHYGGYHLYQHSHIDEDVSIFLVVSDAGLYWVWVGFLVMTAGTFWGFWGRPLVRRVRRLEAPSEGAAA